MAKLDMQYSKVPPHAIEVEKEVLGQILFDGDSMLVVNSLITDELVFYVEAHRKLYRAYLNLYASGRRINIISVTEELKKISSYDIVDGYYLGQLLDISFSSKIEELCLILVEKWIARDGIRLGAQAVQYFHENSLDVFETLEHIESGLSEINNKIQSLRKISLNNQVANTLNKIESGTIRTSVKTYFPEWDRANGGELFEGVYFIGGRPSMGKSSWMLETALRQTKNGHRVGIWSGEMSYEQMIVRGISNISEIPANHITDYNSLSLDKKSLLSIATEEFLRTNLLLDDDAKTIHELKNTIRYWVKFDKAEVVWLDYDRLIKPPVGVFFRSKTDIISFVVEELRLLSKELHIPIFILVQLNRDIEKRAGDKRKPQLSDLKNSGEIEESAFQVAFVDRPHKDGNDPNLAKELIFSIRKNREGKLVDIDCIAELDRYSIKEKPFTTILVDSLTSFDDSDIINEKTEFKHGIHTKNRPTEEDTKLPF